MEFSNTLINWYLQNKRNLPWMKLHRFCLFCYKAPYSPDDSQDNQHYSQPDQRLDKEDNNTNDKQNNARR